MIARAFKKGPAFVGYLTLGDGGLDYSYEAALALIEGGVDLLEIGIPFSDPIADGVIIQKAMQRSLQGGTKAADAIAFIARLRKKTSIPLVLFSYYNPILVKGESFLKEAKAAGAEGILIIDLPFEEPFSTLLDPIYVISPTTSNERIAQIAQKGRGFLYYVCQKGTTGMRSTLSPEIAENLARIKEITTLPVAGGFGICNRAMAKEVIAHADGFVVGSYFVSAMAERASPEELKKMAQAIDPRRTP